MFIFIVIDNFLHLQEAMDNKDLLMSIMALGIIVITAIINNYIYLGTGVAYVFEKEHASRCLFCRQSCVFSALSVPSTWRLDLIHLSKVAGNEFFLDDSTYLYSIVSDRVFSNMYNFRGVLPTKHHDFSESSI